MWARNDTRTCATCSRTATSEAWCPGLRAYQLNLGNVACCSTDAACSTALSSFKLLRPLSAGAAMTGEAGPQKIQ